MCSSLLMFSMETLSLTVHSNYFGAVESLYLEIVKFFLDIIFHLTIITSSCTAKKLH